MIVIFERKQIGDGIWFNRITDERYKVNQISVGFYTEFDDISRADYEIVPYILVDCCEKYPTYQALSRRFLELYGSSLNDITNISGNMRYTGFSATTINDRYALEGEALEQSCCELLIDCMLHPLTKDGVFDAELTRLMKVELAANIESAKNDKRNLAAKQGARIAFEGEPVGEPITGTTEQVELITPESAWKAYRRILETGHIEILAVGNSDFADSERVLSEALSTIDRHDICTLHYAPSRLKSEPRYEVERTDMQQAITRMYFKAPELNDRFAVAVLNMILGGMTTSRFFQNIREKQSLCYYCSSFSNRFLRTITAYAGVEPKNVERTQQAVLAELKAICDNGVTEEEIAHAKLELANEVNGYYDNVSAIGGWYLGQVLEGTFITPEEYLAELNKVDAQRVQNAARMYSLDTVYTLCPEEENA